MVALRKLIRNFVFIIPVLVLLALISVETVDADPGCSIGDGKEIIIFLCDVDICDNGSSKVLCYVFLE